MFVLDTNVVSELRKPNSRVDPNVLAWSQSVDPETVYLSAMTLFELELGVCRVERRDRRQGERLRHWFEEAVTAAFGERVLPFGPEAAVLCAALHIPDPRPMRDSVIAATALAAGMIVVPSRS